MANYTTNLKVWGSTGSEYPDNYNYEEGEQPVDEWDNFLTSNLISDIDHLVSLTNTRLESEVSSSYPSNPENGHLVYRDDRSELSIYDTGNAEWSTVLYADGDTLAGTLDADGESITDTQGPLDLATHIDANGGLLHHEWASKFEGGTVQTGESVSLRAFELADGESLHVTQAHLTQDGFTSPAPSGVDLAIVPEGASGATDTVTVLSGDGTTTFADSRGEPKASYTNTTGSAQVVMVAVDNGEYHSGSGSSEQAFGGFIARIV